MENFSVLRAIELPEGQEKAYGISIAIRSLHDVAFGGRCVSQQKKNRRRLTEGSPSKFR